jgi:hypothetical protein
MYHFGPEFHEARKNRKALVLGQLNTAVSKHEIEHAIRMVLPGTQCTFYWPPVPEHFTVDHNGGCYVVFVDRPTANNALNVLGQLKLLGLPVFVERSRDRTRLYVCYSEYLGQIRANTNSDSPLQRMRVLSYRCRRHKPTLPLYAVLCNCYFVPTNYALRYRLLPPLLIRCKPVLSLCVVLSNCV